MDPYSDVNQRPTIFDGYGHVTDTGTVNEYYSHKNHDFETSHYWINRRWIIMHALFFTQNGGYDASYALGRKDTIQGSDQTHKSKQLTSPHREKMFRQALLGFDTDNEGSKQIPTMEIYLVGYRSWEQILSINDYVAIQVEEQYPDQPYWDRSHDKYDHNGIERRTLMCGLISDIRKTEDSRSKGMIYIVTCQGMQKILNDINLGLPETARQGGVNLLFDINGESNPANETFPFGSPSSASGSSSSSSGSGSAKEAGNVTEQGIIAWCNHMGYSKAQTAGVLANAQGESSMGTAHNGYNLLGYSPGSNTTGTSLLGNVTPSKSNAYKYCQEFYDKTNGGFKQYKSATSSYSAPKCAEWFCAHIDVPDGNDSMSSSAAEQRGSYAEKYMSDIS